MPVYKHRPSPGVVGVCMLLLLVYASCRKVDGARSTPYYWSDSLRPGRIMVVGDLQPTLWVERTFLHRKQNDSVRAHVVAAALRENPDLLLLLGDLVADGAHSADWERFDSVMAPIVHVPIYAVIGNHDYGVLLPTGLKYFHARFPYALTLPRVVRLADSVVMIVLDSNVELLPASLRETQVKRYRELLRRLDNDSAVKGVIVADHHPPYTNSDLRIDDRVRTAFATPFLDAGKTCLFLSGHVHSYERFEIEGKTFIVSGGGGGPRREVDTSASRPHPTDRWRHGRLRPHNYLRIEIDSNGIDGETMMLVGQEFRVGDTWRIEFPKAAGSLH